MSAFEKFMASTTFIEGKAGMQTWNAAIKAAAKVCEKHASDASEEIQELEKAKSDPYVSYEEHKEATWLLDQAEHHYEAHDKDMQAILALRESESEEEKA